MLGTIGVFVLCLSLTLGASDVLVRGLDSLGTRLTLSDGLLGLLTALGADAPEISSAVAAIRAGKPDVGLGVVLGSNLFNLAALLGVSALLAGHVRVHREGLLLDGGVGGAAAVLVAFMLLGGPVAPLMVVLVVLVGAYVVALGVSPRVLAGLPLPHDLAQGLAMAVSEVDRESGADPRVSTSKGSWALVVLLPAALAVIIGGSIGLVNTALVLASGLGVSPRLVGLVVLAGLTSLPNAYAASRLALGGRGVAVVSETMNSNTINLLVGVGAPALLFGVPAVTAETTTTLLWLLALTGLSLVLLGRREGLTRRGGSVVVLLYLAFVALQVSRG